MVVAVLGRVFIVDYQRVVIRMISDAEFICKLLIATVGARNLYLTGTWMGSVHIGVAQRLSLRVVGGALHEGMW